MKFKISWYAESPYRLDTISNEQAASHLLEIAQTSNPCDGSEAAF